MVAKLLAALYLISLALLARAGIQQKDFTGVGRIYVLQSADWRSATPASKVGCLSNSGKFVKDDSDDDCGVFSRLEDYPYTLSTKSGNCTFDDETQERNTDSHYGQMDYAWNCKKGHKSEIYDELYTIVRSHSPKNSTISNNIY